jgi:Tol biopolymer transport system component
MRSVVVLAVVAAATATLNGCGSEPARVGDGIVFASKRTGDFEIYARAGRRLVNLSKTPARPGSEADDYQPSWSPDGRRIAFTSTRDHRGDGNEAWDVYVMDADGGDVHRLSDDFTPDARPGWLPDGRVVFTTCRHGFTHCRFVAVKPTGSDEETLLELGTFVLDATPSPDGKRIAFTRRLRSGAAEVCVRALAGRSQCFGEGGAPTWSPDGKRIVFVSTRARNGRCFFHDCFGFAPELYVMNSDGSAVRRLTHTTAYETDPTFAPNAGQVIFARLTAETDDYELWTIRLDGGGERQLTSNRSWDIMPSWR